MLIGISETLTEMFSGTEAEPAAEPNAEEKPVKKAEKKQKAKEVTLEEVRVVLADKSRQGHTAEVKKLLAKYGADKLSEGKGEFKAGEHCQFCKVKATCRKRAEYNLELGRLVL